MAKFKFGQVTLQVLRFALVIRAGHSALEDTEKILGGIRRLPVFANIFALTVPAVLHRLMVCKLLADFGVEPALVGMQFRRLIGIGEKNIANVRNRRGLDVNDAGFALRFNKRNNLLFVAMALFVAFRPLRRIADIGFISLYRLSLSA